MPYQIEARMRTTPLDRQLGTIDPWSVLSQADWFATEKDAKEVCEWMRREDKRAGIADDWHYRVTFVSIGHPDQFDDQEFAS